MAESHLPQDFPHAAPQPGSGSENHRSSRRSENPLHLHPYADPSSHLILEDTLDLDGSVQFINTTMENLQDQIYNKQFKARKKRFRPSEEQLAILLAVFKRDPRPSTAERLELAECLGATPRSIQIWFQNKRQKLRNEELRDPDTKNRAPIRSRSTYGEIESHCEILNVRPPIHHRDQISPPGTTELKPATLEVKLDESYHLLPPCRSLPDGLITAEMQQLMDSLTSSLPSADTASTFLQPSTSIRSIHQQQQQIRYTSVTQYGSSSAPSNSQLPPIPSPIPSPLPTPFLPLLNSYLSEKILQSAASQSPVLNSSLPPSVQPAPIPTAPRRTTTAKELLDLLDL